MAGRDLFATLPSQQIVAQPVRQGRDLFADEPSFPGAAVVEPAATLITGAIAEPLAGLAGIGRAIFAPSPEEAARRAAETVETTREALTFQPRTEAGRAGLEAVGTVLAPVGKALQAAEQFLGDEAFEATGSPALAAAATMIPTAIIEAIGLAGTKGIIRKAKRTRALSKDKAIRKAVVEAAPDIDQIRDTTRLIHKEIDASGLTILPSSYNGLANRVQSAINRAGFDPTISPKTASAIERISSGKGRIHSFDEINTLRKVAKNVTKTADAADAKLGAIIVDEIDTFLDNISGTELGRRAAPAGTIEAQNIRAKLITARELSRRAKRSELITEAFEKANTSPDVAKTLSTEFKKIIDNKKRSKQFKPKELEVIAEIAKGTKTTNLARLVGRLGFSGGHVGILNVIGGALGFGFGGISGGITVPIIGEVSKRLGSQLLKNKSRLANAIVRAGDKAEDTARAYMSIVPKSRRSVSDLSELLLRRDQNISRIGELIQSESAFIREAGEIAKGTLLLRQAAEIATKAAPSAATLAAPGVIQTQRQEDPRATLKLGLAPE